jgi:pSer/pThr/pTyr-binding forkhead associated (FHA) protein
VAAKLTLYPARGASRHFILRDGQSRQAGRDPAANDLVLEDPRVSSRHARFEWNGSGWSLSDLGSKNGTFLSGQPAAGAPLSDEDWISLGGLLAQFELVSEADLEGLDAERSRRLQTSVELQEEILAVHEPRALLERLLQSVLSLTGAERGFVFLIGPDGHLQAQVASGFASGSLPASIDERFEGSLGAVEHVLSTGESVVVSDAAKDAFLGKRRSVVDLGISTLACVPLSFENRRIGLLYVDGRRQGGVFTDLDVEILEALSGNVSVVLASLRIEREIREMLDAGGASTAESSFLAALGQRVTDIARRDRSAAAGASRRA